MTKLAVGLMLLAAVAGLIVLVVLDAGAPEGQKPATEQDVRELKASVERVDALSDGRAGFEFEIRIPRRGSSCVYAVSPSWAVQRRLLLVHIRSGAGDESAPPTLQRCTFDLVAPDHVPAGKWTLLVSYSYGGLVDHPAPEPEQLAEMPVVLTRD